MANFCENCGSPLKSENKFCPNCGAPVKQTAPNIPPVSASAALNGEGAATSVATAVTATAASHGKTQEPFVPPQPQQDTLQPAMQQHQEPSYGHMPMGDSARSGTGPKYEPDTDLKSMYLRFDNRLNRKRYIMRCLALWAAVMVISILIGFVATALKIKSLSSLGTIISIASAIPSFMLMIRRLHDLDRPTWWCIGAFIPIVNFALGIYLLFFKGTTGSNQYGPDPLEVGD